jgi:endonuclease G, mitochondrial
MSSSSLLRVALFTAGAVVGGGIATVLGSKKTNDTPTIVASPAGKPTNQPAVDLGVTGAPRLAHGTAVMPVLKYGNPGAQITAL